MAVTDGYAEMLINLVRDRLCLWRKSSADYSKKTVKNNNWDDVVKNMVTAGYSVTGK